MILPGAVKFLTDHYVCGNTFRSCWAIREYPTSTSQQALLQHLGEKDGVTLKIYTRTVTAAEERRLYSQAEKSNKLKRNNSNDIRQNVIAEQNLQDVTNVIATQLKNREPPRPLRRIHRTDGLLERKAGGFTGRGHGGAVPREDLGRGY